MPHIIDFQTIGSNDEGYLSIASPKKGIPFHVKRVFWTYDTPTNVIRGRHAHHQTEMVLIAIKGQITINCQNNHQTFTFKLETPNKGLYIPPYCWHTMQYSEDCVQLVLASTEYQEEDYIRDYEKFLKLYK